MLDLASEGSAHPLWVSASPPYYMLNPGCYSNNPDSLSMVHVRNAPNLKAQHVNRPANRVGKKQV